ncbi:hypothetical protein CDAR_587261 [Caerostris darwini]|uniref:Uncharacterized protein n=1 Tax=Caerostris darwini TaxID=1538125 RepID=A0AAV4WFI6_9ARAC|nr:hypothetical protein CDAR_587261 [Caerostris darwini]
MSDDVKVIPTRLGTTVAAALPGRHLAARQITEDLNADDFRFNYRAGRSGVIVPIVMFQQDGAPSHWSADVCRSRRNRRDEMDEMDPLLGCRDLQT